MKETNDNVGNKVDVVISIVKFIEGLMDWEEWKRIKGIDYDYNSVKVKDFIIEKIKKEYGIDGEGDETKRDG